MEIIAILKLTGIITLFVLSMMLIIEYLNVLSHGLWSKGIETSRFKQVFLATFLGIIPGCLGSYTAVSLYVHNIIRVGALVSTMIATSGDEAFLMFSIIPEKAIILNIILLIIAFAVGLIVDYLFKKKSAKFISSKQFHLHQIPECSCFTGRSILRQLIQMTPTRALFLLFLVASFIAIFFSSNHENSTLHQIILLGNATKEPAHPILIKVTFLLVLFISLFVVLSVNDHFLEKHLWGHIIKKHFLKIFLWTFGTLLFVAAINHLYNLNEVIGNNLFVVLLLAVLIGIIPESGPHMIFVLLFANGTIPFSILLASSIVQDGHGSLPLLAESQKSFVIIKAINVLVGIVVGGIALLLGF